MVVSDGFSVYQACFKIERGKNDESILNSKNLRILHKRIYLKSPAIKKTHSTLMFSILKMSETENSSRRAMS